MSAPQDSHVLVKAPLSRRSRRRRVLAAAVAIGAALLLIYAFSVPILTAVGNQLVHSDPLERADVIVVLAPMLDRVVEAANLYAGGYAPRILLTREEREPAEQMLIDRGILDSGEDARRRILHALGVPLDAIAILDGYALSTAAEAVSFAEWARARPVHSVIVVTSPFHTERSRLTFVRALQNLDVKVIVRPSTLTQFQRDTWWRSRSTLREGVFELQRLLYYRLVELPRLTPPGRAHVPVTD